MKLATIAAGAALMVAVALSANPADAGQKAKKQKWTSHGNVYIGSQISSKNLKALERQLKGHQKDAVSQELKNRQKSYEVRSSENSARRTGERLVTRDNSILELWAMGTMYGRRKRGH